MKDNIGRAGFPALLVERGLIGVSGLQAAQSRAARDRMELADAVVALGVKEHDSYAALAAAAGAELIPLGEVRSSELAVRLVPERLARRLLIVPLEVDNRVLTYATCRPFNVEGENDLQFAAGRRTAFKVATRTAILGALDACYRSTQPSDTFTTGRRRPEPTPPARTVPSQLGRIRVLVTDDEPISRMVVKVLLEHDNYDVIEAVDGQQAIEMAVRERPNLVLIDLNMPVMDGYEAITALRREFTLRELPIIVLTSEEGDSVERRVLELGADDYLVKPFEPAVLMARVNAVFHRLNLVAS